MKITIIGADDSIDKIMNFAINEYKDIEFICFKHEEISTIEDVFPKIPNDTDGIFATGIGVYNALINYNFTCPITYVKRGALGLIKAFHELYLKKQEIKDKSISFDSIDRYYVDNVLNEFNIPIKNYYLEDDFKEKSESYFIDKHLKLYHQGKVNYIFTSFGYIYSLFKSLNLPVIRIHASKMEIRNDINSLIKAINMDNLDKKSLMVYKFTIDEMSKYNQFKEILEDYTSFHEGFLSEESKTKFTLICNKGFSDYKGLRLSLAYLKCLDKDLFKNMKIGISLGPTIGKALDNVEIAMQNTNYIDKIFFYDGNILQKINESLDINNKIDELSNEKLEKISNETGIRSIHIQTISLCIKALNRNTFTAKDLAEILNLTSRSANRIINALVESNYAEEIENKAFNERAGRPKRMVKIHF